METVQILNIDLKEHDVNVKKGLVLAGGGVLGTVHVGALSELFKLGYKFDYFVGSSIGAFICTLLSCRCPIQDMIYMMMNLDYSAIYGGNVCLSGMYNTFKNKGWYNTNKLREMYSNVIKDLCGKSTITFQEIYKQYGTHLAMTATHLSTSSIVFFDRNTHPEMSVVDACVYSSTAPFVFTSNEYVDGGLIDNYPIGYMHDLIGEESTLGINFHKTSTHTQRNPDTLLNFIHIITDIILEQAFELHLTEEGIKNTITVNIPDISSFKLSISNSEKEKLFKYGVDAIKNYFNLF